MDANGKIVIHGRLIHGEKIRIIQIAIFLQAAEKDTDGAVILRPPHLL